MRGRDLRTGAGKRAGRRPQRLRMEKRELERVIRALYERGLGCRIVGKLTGYSPSQIHMYAKDWGLPAASPNKTLEWYESLLPEDLRADLRIIRTRSDVYLERAKNKERPVAPRVHMLLDINVRKGRNTRAKVRPAKTEAA